MGTLGENLKRIRESKGLGVNELSRLANVSAGYISALERNEKTNPSLTMLDKLSKALDVTTNDLFGVVNNEIAIDYYDTISESPGIYKTSNFKTAEEAMKFILEQPTIMGYGGFDINKLSNEDIIEFAEELLNQLKILSYKYKR